VLSYGATALNGRDRTRLLAEDTEAYRIFRRDWNSIKTRLLELIPIDRQPVDVFFEFIWIKP
jgi:hypothetical protein